MEYPCPGLQPRLATLTFCPWPMLAHPHARQCATSSRACCIIVILWDLLVLLIYAFLHCLLLHYLPLCLWLWRSSCLYLVTTMPLYLLLLMLWPPYFLIILMRLACRSFVSFRITCTLITGFIRHVLCVVRKSFLLILLRFLSITFLLICGPLHITLSSTTMQSYVPVAYCPLILLMTS